jgi:hypothetical protein
MSDDGWLEAKHQAAQYSNGALTHPSSCHLLRSVEVPMVLSPSLEIESE